MTAFKRNIVFISLLITTLCFNACQKKNVPEALLNYKNSKENSADYLENLSKLADSCSEKYARNPIFLEKSAQIYFQNGEILYQKNDYINATKSFMAAYDSQKTLISLKKHTENNDYCFLGQIFENIGDIYFDINSIKPASYFYDQALNIFENIALNDKAAGMLTKIGELYFFNHIPEIALLNYETAENKQNLTNEQFNTIQIKKGIALYAISDIESADSIYEKISAQQLNNIDFQYFTGQYFYYKNNFRKALPYLQKCFDEGTPKLKAAAAEILASLYFSLNNHEKELYFAQYQTKAQSSEARMTPAKMELETLYDDFIERNKTKNGKDASANDWLLIVMAAILIGVVIILIYFKKSHRILQDKNKIIDNISKQLEETKKQDVVSRSFTRDYENFVHTKIYTEIKDSMNGKVFLTKTVDEYPRLALTKVQIATLTTKFNESFPNLIHSLSDIYPSLTSSDFRYIILSIMGFSVVEIAVLLRLQYSSVNKRDNKIQNIFHTNEELRLFLPHFLNKIKY